MSTTQEERHPFLDDLADDAQLISSVLRGAVVGRDEIRRVVDAVGTFYVEQTPISLDVFGSRTLLQYEALLKSGERLNAAVVIDRSPDGSVSRVNVRMAPVDAIISLATHLKTALAGQLPEQLFL